MQNLKDAIKKGGLIALGLAVITKEQAEKAAKILLAKGQANEKNVKELGQKIMAEAKSAQKKMQSEAKKAVSMLQKKVKAAKKPAPKKAAKRKPVKK